jgi:hypothetical protein
MPSTVYAAAAAAAAGLVAVADGHICLFAPTQRGPALPSRLSAGEDLCYRRTPYCGGVPLPAQAPAGNTFVAGQLAQIAFQQNLNHFWEASPGSLDIAVSYNLNPSGDDDAADDWQTLFSSADFAANDMVTQTNFSVGVQMPARAADHVLLRVRYASHNAGEVDPANNTDSIFYNCADVRLVAAPSGDADHEETVAPAAAMPAVAAPQLTQKQKDASGCTTPAQWLATAVETTAGSGTVQHTIVHDRTQEIVSWSACAHACVRAGGNAGVSARHPVLHRCCLHGVLLRGARCLADAAVRTCAV